MPSVRSKGLVSLLGVCFLAVATEKISDATYTDLPSGLTAMPLALHYAGCIANRGANGCKRAGHKSLGDASNLVVSPDGKNVYVASDYSNSVTWLARRADGGLRYGGCFAYRGQRGCRTTVHDSLNAAWGIAVSPDGSSVYVTSLVGDSITRFDRAPTGALRFVACIANDGKNGCTEADHASLDLPLGIAVSPGSRSIYVNSGERSNAITSFELAGSRGP
jgi:hypothetical protein